MNRDLVLHRQQPEIDRDVVRRDDAVGDPLSIDDHVDARIVESGADHDVVHALDLALRLAVARQDDLRRRRVQGRRCDRGCEEKREKTTVCYAANNFQRSHISADTRIGSC